MDLNTAEWRKSAYSGDTGHCVQVAINLPGVVAVRDSKDASGAVLVVGREEWADFLRKIRLG